MARCWFLLVLVVALSLAQQVNMAVALPDPGQLAAYADAYKQLKELDKYYSQVARPSPRSAPGISIETFTNALRMLRLQELDRIYSQRLRPRFGKRMEMPPYPPEEALAEAGERLFGHLGGGQPEARR